MAKNPKSSRTVFTLAHLSEWTTFGGRPIGYERVEDALNAVYKVKESRPLWSVRHRAHLDSLRSLLIIAALNRIPLWRCARPGSPQ